MFIAFEPKRFYSLDVEGAMIGGRGASDVLVVVTRTAGSPSQKPYKEVVFSEPYSSDKEQLAATDLVRLGSYAIGQQLATWLKQLEEEFRMTAAVGLMQIFPLGTRRVELRNLLDTWLESVGRKGFRLAWEYASPDERLEWERLFLRHCWPVAKPAVQDFIDCAKEYPRLVAEAAKVEATMAEAFVAFAKRIDSLMANATILPAPAPTLPPTEPAPDPSDVLEDLPNQPDEG